MWDKLTIDSLSLSRHTQSHKMKFGTSGRMVVIRLGRCGTIARDSLHQPVCASQVWMPESEPAAGYILCPNFRAEIMANSESIMCGASSTAPTRDHASSNMCACAAYHRAHPCDVPEINGCLHGNVSQTHSSPEENSSLCAAVSTCRMLARRLFHRVA